MRPREDQRYGELLALARRLKREGALPRSVRAGSFADMLWGLLNIGTYRNLVIERGWSLRQYRQWVQETVRLRLAA
jgi:hypothetical protein